ncbi:MAG TPA: hypothetical protein VFZ52_04095 [Chryseolinea sp.]
MNRLSKGWRSQIPESVATSRASVNVLRSTVIKFVLLASVFSGLIISCDDDDEVPLWHEEMSKLRAAVTPYDFIEHAEHDGYDTEVTGYRPHMGYHYLNAGLLDDAFEVERPELLLYAPDENNKLKFVAVEYAVPIEDLNNPPPVPEGFKGRDDVWEINTEFKLWTLHVWVKLENPNGIFASHNPVLH